MPVPSQVANAEGDEELDLEEDIEGLKLDDIDTTDVNLDDELLNE